MTISDLLDATKPIIYETGVEEYPYALSGTCYPVRYHRNLFVVSAFHCYKNFNIEPEQTLYPRPANPTEFFALDRWFRAHAAESKDDEHYDQIVLRIARTDHSDSEIAQVAALDLAIPTNARLPTGSNIKDFLIRGYPFGAQVTMWTTTPRRYRSKHTARTVAWAFPRHHSITAIQFECSLPSHTA